MLSTVPESPAAPAEHESSPAAEAAPRSINRLITDRRLSWYAQAKFALVRGFLWTWVSLFGLTGLYWFGKVFATVEFLVNRGRRKRYRKVLERVYPQGFSRARELRIIRRYFRRTRCDKLFYLIYDKLPRHKVLSRIRFHGRDHLEAGLGRGNGVYLAMSHHGSHHVLGMLLSLLGYKLTGIRDRNEGALRSYMQQTIGPRMPEFKAVQMLFADDFPREIFRCFRENRLIISALDANRPRGVNLKTCPVHIFGETREFLTGPIQIALRCGATIVPTFLVSRPNFYYRIMVMPPLHAGAGDPPELATIMQGYADAVAEHIRHYPDHLSRI
jgi:lauroyl/myristoyl acyltransferase